MYNCLVEGGAVRGLESLSEWVGSPGSASGFEQVRRTTQTGRSAPPHYRIALALTLIDSESLPRLRPCKRKRMTQALATEPGGVTW